MALQVTIPVIAKDPSAFLPYGFDLSVSPMPFGKPYLAPRETVTALTVTSDPGITVASSGIYNNAAGVPAQVVAWIGGGTIGTSYNVRFQFTTNLGNTDCRSISIQCVAR
ncbi:phage fiber-tail adaptor protein [Paraburkholderia atlantica]|uniref:phage fiber-tail adaptor protein n=1 Tax=Paraburkholderia atlantica TaxID=2654982 RepID=UPI00160BD12C|nr:hypothetical protein [Paraburkholderia atlantica]MBB5508178.1 hypothetical protein [Paraburkholderia atlantica]